MLVGDNHFDDSRMTGTRRLTGHGKSVSLRIADQPTGSTVSAPSSPADAVYFPPNLKTMPAPNLKLFCRLLLPSKNLVRKYSVEHSSLQRPFSKSPSVYGQLGSNSTSPVTALIRTCEQSRGSAPLLDAFVSLRHDGGLPGSQHHRSWATDCNALMCMLYTIGIFLTYTKTVK